MRVGMCLCVGLCVCWFVIVFFLLVCLCRFPFFSVVLRGCDSFCLARRSIYFFTVTSTVDLRSSKDVINTCAFFSVLRDMLIKI